MAPVTWNNLWRNGGLVCSAGVVTKIYTIHLTFLLCVIVLMEERLHQLICRTPFETGFNPFSVGDAVFLLLTLSVDFRLKKTLHLAC